MLTFFLIAGGLMMTTNPAGGAAVKDRPAPPFWLDCTVRGESVLFVAPTAGGPPAATLWFPPVKVLSVRNAAGTVTYAEGRDYVLAPGGRLTLPAGSAIPAKTAAELTPPKGSQPYGLVRRDGAGDILFGASHEYHDAQAQVTYTRARDAWRGPAPILGREGLAPLRATLKRGGELRVAVFGDSISTGCNASKWAGVAPLQPAYPELVAGAVEAAYGGRVALTNFAVGGMTSSWGVGHVAPVAESKPDLVILAWGMNDANAPGLPPAQFAANLEAQIAAIRKVNPDAAFVLVAPMLPNEMWRVVVPGLIEQYRDAMRPLCGAGVALADLSAVWRRMVDRKNYLDITGNGVNHPNDFGHRLYAETIGALLLP